jgi:hypothetical protein
VGGVKGGGAVALNGRDREMERRRDEAKEEK